MAGNIEHIGLKTTRIRALSGEQVVIANDLLRQIVHNYKRMNTRRIVFVRHHLQHADREGETPR